MTWSWGLSGYIILIIPVLAFHEKRKLITLPFRTSSINKETSNSFLYLIKALSSNEFVLTASCGRTKD